MTDPRREQPRMRGDHVGYRVLPGLMREQPRMRGDHREAVTIGGDSEGTAPHARGPLARPLSVAHGSGNSPACAGTTQPAV